MEHNVTYCYISAGKRFAKYPIYNCLLCLALGLQSFGNRDSSALGNFYGPSCRLIAGQAHDQDVSASGNLNASRRGLASGSAIDKNLCAFWCGVYLRPGDMRLRPGREQNIHGGLDVVAYLDLPRIGFVTAQSQYQIELAS